RLERGTFAFPAAATAEVSITATELAMILGGIELGSARRRPRYEQPAAGGPPRGSVPGGETRHPAARTTGMAPPPAPDTDPAALRAEAAPLRQGTQELLATVAELRATVEKQQVHIDRLVRMTFGRRSEKVTGPTLSDDVPDPVPSPAAETLTTANPPPEAATPRRRGHGRRPPTCPGSASRST